MDYAFVISNILAILAKLIFALFLIGMVVLLLIAIALVLKLIFVFFKNILGFRRSAGNCNTVGMPDNNVGRTTINSNSINLAQTNAYEPSVYPNRNIEIPFESSMAVSSVSKIRNIKDLFGYLMLNNPINNVDKFIKCNMIDLRKYSGLICSDGNYLLEEGTGVGDAPYHLSKIKSLNSIEPFAYIGRGNCDKEDKEIYDRMKKWSITTI